MTIKITNIEDYLKIIDQGLHDFPDKDIIIQELRDYIWDLANDIAKSSGKHYEECFQLAVDKLEKPEMMIAQFKQEDANSTPKKQIKRKNHIKTPLFLQRKTSLAQLCVFSLLTLGFMYFLIRTLDISAFHSEIILINVVRVLFIFGFITGLTFLYDIRILKHQQQKIRQLFTKDKDVIKIKLGRKSIPFINIKIFQITQLMLSSLFTLTILVLIIINNSNELSNQYPFLIEEYTNYVLIALAIICCILLVSNSIPFWIRTNWILRLARLVTTMITLAAMASIIYYYPFDFRYLNSIIDQNMQTLFLLILGYLFMKMMNQMAHILSTTIKKRKQHQEEEVISSEERK
jgi:hypothetical protein